MLFTFFLWYPGIFLVHGFFFCAGATGGGRKPQYLNVGDVLLLVPAPIVDDIKKVVMEEMDWDFGGGDTEERLSVG